ncbi:MAG: PqqD family protein [Thermoleophilaceae bacterium]
MADERNTSEDAMLDAVAHVPEHVVHRTFEAETLLLNLDTGQYHGLNETGGRMLQLLEASDGRVREAIQKLADEYEIAFEEIAPDLLTFCSSLESRGLIQVTKVES